MNLYETLRVKKEQGNYPMHMPGHKRNPQFIMENPYSFDTTEVEGTDNLHHPTGVIRKLQERIASHSHAKKSYLLVNGSTCGILTAISSCCKKGETILVARNCHRSVYHALYLLELRPVYLVPATDHKTGISLAITAKQVEQALAEHPEAKGVILTSPTYEGVMSDIAAIAGKVHERELCLIVDEAHGAHLSWAENLPASAMEQGADLVIESYHKTLPSLTQTAVLHRCSERVSDEEICRYLDIYETSSPSYVLMASVEQCVDWLIAFGKEAFYEQEKHYDTFREQAEKWQVLSLWRHPDAEPSKLVITIGRRVKFYGTDLADCLRVQYHIEVEMAAPGYIIAMTSVGDSKEGWERLAEALTEIDKELMALPKEEEEIPYIEKIVLPPYRMSAYAAVNHEWETVLLGESKGKISAEYAFLYPPGIPFLVPGEEINEFVLAQMKQAKEQGLELLGLAEESGESIRVVRTEVM